MYHLSRYAWRPYLGCSRNRLLNHHFLPRIIQMLYRDTQNTQSPRRTSSTLSQHRKPSANRKLCVLEREMDKSRHANVRASIAMIYGSFRAFFHTFFPYDGPSSIGLFICFLYGNRGMYRTISAQ